MPIFELTKTFSNLNVSKMLKALNFTSLFLLFSCCLFSQNYISILSENDVSFDTEELERIAFLKQDTLIDTTYFISLGDIIDYQDEGKLSFSLPSYSSVEAELEIIKYWSEDTFSWSGNFTNYNGVIIVSERSLGKYVSIQIEHDFFDIIPINDSYKLLRKFIHDVAPGEHCGSSFLGENEESEENILDRGASTFNDCESFSPCTAIIDVIALIPPDTRNLLNQSGGSARVDNGFMAMNTALKNSKINSRIRWKEVDIPGFNYANPPSVAANLIELEQIGPYYRDQHEADLVMFLGGQRLGRGGNVGKASGCALYPTSQTPSSSCAYAIGELWFHASPIWLSAHELGHLLSGLHDELRISECPNGKVLERSGSGRTTTGTIMASTTENVLHYSHPDVSWNNIPTGDNGKKKDEYRFNAKNMSNVACRVQNYNNGANFNIKLIAPPVICYEIENPITLIAEVNQPSSGHSGIPPYSYNWTWNKSGIFTPSNSGNFIGTNKNQLFDIPYGLNYVFVKLEVTSSDGIAKSEIKKIDIQYEGSGYCFGFLRKNIEPKFNSFENNVDVLVYPNPTGDITSIELKIPKYSKTSIELVNTFGKKVKLIHHGYLQQGNHNFKLNLSNLNLGVYYINVNFDNYLVKTVKIVK